MTLNRTPSSPWAFNSHSSSRTAIHNFNRSNVMWHVYELFCPACCILKCFHIEYTEGTCVLCRATRTSHLATCNTSARRAENGSLFGSSNRFSTSTGDPTHILQPLLGSDPFGVSQGHSGSESNEPSLAHQVAASHRKMKSWSENWIEKNWPYHEDEARWFNTLIVTSNDHKALLLKMSKVCPSLLGASSKRDPPRIQPGNASVIWIRWLLDCSQGDARLNWRPWHTRFWLHPTAEHQNYPTESFKKYLLVW